MFHIRREGQKVRRGFNFYPWKDRRYSVGFVFNWGDWYWQFRYAPRIRRLYNNSGKMI